ncbi:hypothetical protein [Candidatus Electronema sp. PJ]|uniref:hypothetical protein n=1 Tax=Candidatus Electronema sp. PJ TaxID=3401572 RepID=UPI003AA863ED
MICFLRSVALACLICCLPAFTQASPQPPAKTAKKIVVAPPAQSKSSDRPKIPPVMVILPAPALQQTLSSILPLPIEHNASEQFRGEITLDSISSLTVDGGRIRIIGQLSGRNMTMNASVGNQNIQVKLGSLVLPVVCDVDLRFDPARQMLLLTPHFQRSTRSGSDSDEALLALLNSLSKQYEVPLHNFMPLTGEIGSNTVRLRMEPLDIRAADGAVTLRLKPVAGKQP